MRAPYYLKTSGANHYWRGVTTQKDQQLKNEAYMVPYAKWNFR
jgi:hypothetical protein